MKKKGKAGFTLIEIMIVVLIIGLLAAIAVPSFVRARDRSRISACVNNLRQIDAAKEQWAMESNATQGPFSGDWADYIRGGLPSCPTGSDYNPQELGEPPTCASGMDGHVLEPAVVGGD